MKNLLRVGRVFQEDLVQIVFAILLLLAAVLANLFKPWPLSLIVDSVISGKPLPGWLPTWFHHLDQPILLAFLTAAILFLYILHGALTARQTFLLIQIGLRGLERVRNELFHCLQQLSLRFYQRRTLGDLIYRASWDTYAFQTLFHQGLFNFLTASLSLFVMIIIMWHLSVQLCLVALASIPLLFAVMLLFGREMNRRSQAARQTDSQVTALYQQTMVAMPLIQSYSREEEETARFTAHTRQARQIRQNQHASEVLYLALIAFIFGLAAAAIILLGTEKVIAQQLTIGQLLIFVAYLGQFYEPLSQLSAVGVVWSDSSAGIKRVLEILDSHEEIVDAPDAKSLTQKPSTGTTEVSLGLTPSPEVEAGHSVGNIQFDHVWFSYDPETVVLRDVSFTVRAGDSVAIVGQSGTGKSTLLNLLPRLYDPTAGSVWLDGIELRHIKLKELRAQISLVLQEAILLPATVSENIGYGKPGAHHLEIELAARAAGAHDFIEKLPQGYRTVIGEGATRLSVGEKQRINLARAFLKNAPILVLDEPTSALDPESEALVLASLNILMQGRTTFIVAHGLPLIRQAKKILVLEGERLTEMGTHDELIALNGYYAKAVAAKKANRPMTTPG